MRRSALRDGQLIAWWRLWLCTQLFADGLSFHFAQLVIMRCRSAEHTADNPTAIRSDTDTLLGISSLIPSSPHSFALDLHLAGSQHSALTQHSARDLKARI